MADIFISAGYNRSIMLQAQEFALLFQFFSFITRMPVVVLIFVLLFFLVLKQEEKYMQVLLFVLTGFLTVVLTEFVLKPLFATPRPEINQFCTGAYSFPSTHAALSFAWATILSLFSSVYAAMFFSMAVLISYSRIFLNCHYFSDVLVGAVIGVVVAKLLYLLLGRKI